MKPTTDSIELAQGMMDEKDSLLVYIAIIIGRTMELNHRYVETILDECREEFNALGAGKEFENLEEKLDGVFRSFFNEEDES